MKIKEFSIGRYGPFPRRGPYILGNFNLFWGKNETGKTMMVEALLKMIFKKESKLKDEFRGIDRVKDDIQEGEIVFADEKGKEYEPAEFLNKLNLSPAEFRNVFVIRNSDLTIDESYYPRITERLTGERIHEINNIIKNLRDLGKLTPKGDISDDRRYKKLFSKLKEAKALIEQINTLKEEAKKKKVEEFERRLVELEEEINEYERKKKNLEDARKREDYEKGISVLNELKNLLTKIKEMYPFNEEEREKWIRNEEEVKRGKEEIEKLKQEMERSEKEVGKMEEEVHKLDERMRKCEDIRGDIKNYEKKKEAEKIVLPVLVVSGAFSCGFLVALFLKPSLILFILTSFTIISSLISVFFLYRIKKTERWLSRKAEEGLGIEVQKVEEIYFQLQLLEKEYGERKKELEEMKNKKLPSLREKIDALQRKIRGHEEEIEKIKMNSKVSSFEEYRVKLQEKQKLNEMIREKEGSLTMLLGKKPGVLEDKLSFWEEKIKELEEYKDRAKDFTPSEKEKEELEGKIKKCREELEKVKNELSVFHTKLDRIEEISGKILEELVRCKSIADLEGVQLRLKNFIEENEKNAHNARRAIEIFEEILKEAKEKLSALFGSRGPVSEHFRNITNGLYKEVHYEEKGIKAIKWDNTYVKAEDLSGGAYDQLYFSIRLALAEKILGGEKGFFILDDPFIKSDPDRLERQIEMLKKISESGWQIIYFSAKKEIKDALKQYCEERKGYFELY